MLAKYENVNINPNEAYSPSRKYSDNDYLSKKLKLLLIYLK